VIRALALSVLAAALLATPAVARPSPSDLEGQLVCPVCGTTLDQSDAPVAQRMKQIIRERLAAGESEAQIKAELVDQFGPGVLAEPPKSGFDLLAWVVPLAVLLGGALGVGLIAWGWSRRRADGDGSGSDAKLDPELERRVDAELQRFEG
jgi:cytochrome c-type biogenesis protein CcmH